MRPGLMLLLAGVSALLAACNRDQLPAYPQRPIPQNLAEPAIQAHGSALFARLCAGCHGRSGEGRSSRADFFVPPAPDFTAPVYRTLPADYLYWRIEHGKSVEPYLSRGSVMPAWGPTLSEADIWALVAALRRRAGS